MTIDKLSAIVVDATPDSGPSNAFAWRCRLPVNEARHSPQFAPPGQRALRWPRLLLPVPCT